MMDCGKLAAHLVATAEEILKRIGGDHRLVELGTAPRQLADAEPVLDLGPAETPQCEQQRHWIFDVDTEIRQTFQHILEETTPTSDELISKRLDVRPVHRLHQALGIPGDAPGHGMSLHDPLPRKAHAVTR